MNPREDVFTTFWYFAGERQRIFLRRFNDENPPWTDDKILKTYKFCNAYRASDRVSQFLIREVIYSGRFSDRDTVFRILLFRLFNNTATWRYLENQLKEVSADNFDFDVYAQALSQRIDNGKTIFGNAFILSGQKVFGYDRKHKNYLALILAMLEENLPEQIMYANSLEEIYNLLHAYPLLGDFMSYQLAIDINYSEVVNFSENDFTVAGPGAQRGIKKCFQDTGDKSHADVIQWMTKTQNKHFNRFDIDFPDLWGRPLKAIDIQNLFCEVDKYARVAFPDLKSNRSQIKSEFSPSSQSIDYFYPPKWGINDKTEN